MRMTNAIHLRIIQESLMKKLLLGSYINKLRTLLKLSSLSNLKNLISSIYNTLEINPIKTYILINTSLIILSLGSFIVCIKKINEQKCFLNLKETVTFFQI